MPDKRTAKHPQAPKYPGLVERIKDALGTRRQTEVAKRLGVTPSSVSDWKSGGAISVDTLVKVAQLSNTFINWLLTGEGPKFIPDSAEGDAGNFLNQPAEPTENPPATDNEDHSAAAEAARDEPQSFAPEDAQADPELVWLTAQLQRLYDRRDGDFELVSRLVRRLRTPADPPPPLSATANDSPKTSTTK